MFLVTTPLDMKKRNWDKLDIILVTGDSYIDSPFIGISLIGKFLAAEGYKVGIIAQPDINTDSDITRLGEPSLFWGISGGCIDSMVANYTSLKRKRRKDDYTPGGINDRRPDRAAIVYSNLIRKYFKSTVPIVLGGLEASLRRIAHYDYWDDRIRGSILIDAKADYLVYGMGEKAIIELAARISKSSDPRSIRGLCYVAGKNDFDHIEKGYIKLPSFDAVSSNSNNFIEMFHKFYLNNNPMDAVGLYQRHGDRDLVHNPPSLLLTTPELDKVYSLYFERAQHPYYEKFGKVKALETIKFSIVSHRGCYGECNFCAISLHEGRIVHWRSEASIIEEAKVLTKYKDFTGYIRDLGGPTANMYGFDCKSMAKYGPCKNKHCLTPKVCPKLDPDHSRQIDLLKKLRKLKGIKKIFIASGIRYDLIEADGQHGKSYLKDIIQHHISGQLKVAPEHSENKILKLMGKPEISSLVRFKKTFDYLSAKIGKKQFLTYYFIAAHPSCTQNDMQKLKQFVSQNLKTNPEQIQIFLPAPSTWSSVMYHTEIDPFTGRKLYVEKILKKKQAQKEILLHQCQKPKIRLHQA